MFGRPMIPPDHRRLLPNIGVFEPVDQPGHKLSDKYRAGELTNQT